jgi:hypothetical protein
VAEKVSLLCIHETKLNVISTFDIMQLAGNGFDYVFLPAVETRGGILVALKASVWLVSHHSIRRFSISIRVKRSMGGGGGLEWWLSTIYGPSTDVGNPDFLDELHDLRQVRTGPWLLCGDFNMIY